MKFGKQLQLGTFEPWSLYYIQYSKLKRIINRTKFIKAGSKTTEKNKGPATEYSLLRQPSPASATGGGSGKYTGIETGEPLQTSPPSDEDSDFFAVIQSEIDKVNKFFVGKLATLRIALEEITNKRRNAYRSHHASTGNEGTDLIMLRDIYIELAALRSYCDLNQTGFYKIIKKYDKTMEEETLEKWMKTIEQQPFVMTPEPLQLMNVVTSLVSRAQLIEWERFATEQHSKSGDDIFPAVRSHGLLLSLAVFFVSLAIPLVTPDDPAASRCMSLLLLVICLWITEAIPYFSTALLIPPLVTFMGVLKDGTVAKKLLPTHQAAEFVVDHVFNHTTMLLLGGYTISSAFSRCQLELRLASWMQLALGKRPRLFILAVMLVGLFLSMWISNHTAPILCATIILPIVRDLPTESRFSRSLLLGLAFSCNFGGMMTPISSLQNALAVSYLEQAGIVVSFGKWIAVALPFSVICTLICWLMIVVIEKPDDVTSIPGIAKLLIYPYYHLITSYANYLLLIHCLFGLMSVIVYERSSVIGKRNLAVIVLSLFTILLFATSALTNELFGDISIISLCFVAVMFGTGMLTEVDFNSLSWHTLFLVGGGNVLGKAVESSGLLAYIADGITGSLPLGRPWIALVYILLFCGTISTFVSHTVASIILMPVIARIGVSMQIPEVVVIGSAFSVSAAMALPFSSFPNVNSLLILDDFQRPYLKVQDFVRTGLPMSLLSIFLIATLGFGLINFFL